MSDRRRHIVRLCVVAIGLGVGAGAAETESVKTPAMPEKNRQVSQRVSELIRAELPHYELPAADNSEADEAAGAGIMLDDTFHLPTITVREVRKAPPTSTDWLTGYGRLDFALKRFPGTRIGNFFGWNNPWAEARLAEDIAAERHQAMKDLGHSVLLVETPEDLETEKLLKAALMYSGRPAPK